MAWITHNRHAGLKRSIESFKKASLKSPLDFKLVVSNSGQTCQKTMSPELENEVFILEDQKRLCWIDELKKTCQKEGVKPSLLSFALNPFTQAQSSAVVTTGANRNALLLALAGHKFISVDDDVIFELARSNEKKKSVSLMPTSVWHFKSHIELDQFKRMSEVVSLDDLIKGHQSLLDSVDKTSYKKCLLSLTGYFGDSGYSGPRGVFSLDDAALIDLVSNNQLETALTSRLIWSQSESAKLIELSTFMPICAGFSNDCELPPFFPIGRNQDGAYAYAVHGCLASAMIGHLDLAIKHDPIEVRSYDGSLSQLKLRVNDLLALLWVGFLRKSLPKGYQGAAEYFRELTLRSDEDFYQIIRTLVSQHMVQRAQRLKGKIDHLERIVEPDMNPWKTLAAKEVLLFEMNAKDPFNCVPSEAVIMTSNNSDAIALTKSWLDSYANLLEAWPTIRRMAKKVRPDKMQ